jgi:queuine tRNA-ribosyltransferase
MLGLQIATLHNMSFFLALVREAREHIQKGDFASWKSQMVPQLERKL